MMLCQTVMKTRSLSLPLQMTVSSLLTLQTMTPAILIQIQLIHQIMSPLLSVLLLRHHCYDLNHRTVSSYHKHSNWTTCSHLRRTFLHQYQGDNQVGEQRIQSRTMPSIANMEPNNLFLILTNDRNKMIFISQEEGTVSVQV